MKMEIQFPYTNDDANGNAWFVKKLEKVNSANEEIKALDSLDTKNKASIYDFEYGRRFKAYELPIYMWIL